MAAKSKEFASVRLPSPVKQQVVRMARAEKRSLSQMLKLLVEEALAQRSKGGYSYAVRYVNSTDVQAVNG